MAPIVKTFIICFCCLIVLNRCTSPTNFFASGDSNRIYTGTLDDSVNASLRRLLMAHATSSLKDTIIIKYDYNNESCWDRLDQENPGYIQGFIARSVDQIQLVRASRPNVSAFCFREPGNNINKIKKWDQSIIIDSSEQLLKLLFAERSKCGNSIIVMPDKRFLFMRSDSHFEALHLGQNKILEHLARN